MQYGKPFPKGQHQQNVFGDVRFAYDIDGQTYNASKEPVDSRGNIMPIQPVAKTMPPVVISDEDKGDNNGQVGGEDDTPEDEKEIDLRGWADGTAKYAFNVIQAEIARLWDITGVKGKAEAIAIILEKLPAKQ